MKKLFSCSFCNKELTTNARLQTHIQSCKKHPEYKPRTLVDKVEELKKNLEEQKEIIEEQGYMLRQQKEQFEYEIKKLETRPLSITNNIEQQINNHNHISITNYLTEERVKETFSEKFTIESLLGSQKELANFTIDNFLTGKDKPIYLCTDRSRKNLHSLMKMVSR